MQNGVRGHTVIAELKTQGTVQAFSVAIYLQDETSAFHTFKATLHPDTN